jgi:hypothetical protein
MFLQLFTKYCYLLILFGCLFVHTSLEGQPAYGTTSVENCYQKVTAGFTGKAKKVNFIKSQYNIKISTTNYKDIRYWQILVPDTFTRYLRGPDTIVSRVDTFWRIKIDSITSTSQGATVNIPPQYNRIRITNPKDWFSGVLQPDTLEINFVEPEFDFFDKQKECLTFDMEELQCKLNLTNLCLEPTYRLILPPNATNRWGLPLNWFMTLEPLKKGQSIPINPAACSGQYWDQYGNTISYCMDFQLEVLIRSCYDKENICPPLMIKKKLKFCCFCGPWNNIQN